MAVREISKEMALKALNELNEDPKRISSDIEAIRLWLKKQPHLAETKISDQRILAFLRGCKFSLERCKEKIDMYFTLKNLAPELLQNRDPNDKKIQEILSLGVALPFLDLKNPTDTRVFLIRLGSFDSSKYTLAEVMKVTLMINDILMEEDDNFVISGEQLFVDLKGVSIDMIAQFTPGLAKKLTSIAEKIYPIRQKGYHMINTPFGFEAGYALFKGFLSNKLQSRIHVHNLDMDSLRKHIPKKILPKEYGGDGRSIQELIDHWKRKVESYRDWFMEEDNYKSNEKLRPGKPKISDEMIGIDGSFRKLNLD